MSAILCDILAEKASSAQRIGVAIRLALQPEYHRCVKNLRMGVIEIMAVNLG
jgi:hypothetical protein